MKNFMNFFQTLILLFVFFQGTMAFSQSLKSPKCANWYFGYQAGIHFDGINTPTVPVDGRLWQAEGCASISDETGNLIFYTDGRKVYDRSHTCMPNGTDLMGHYDAAQSAIIIPQPGSTTIYYIFTMDEDDGSNGMNYSVVDMAQNNEYGDVTLKNIHLIDTQLEKVVAIEHANQQDIWVLADCNNSFYAFLVTQDGVQVDTPVVTPHNYISYPGGVLKFSHDGTKLICTRQLSIFDFDASTGIASNEDIIEEQYYAGAEFSPDDSKLYVSLPMERAEGYIYQFDLESGDINEIRQSKTQVGESKITYYQDLPVRYAISDLQLAPDGKIYGAGYHNEYLDVIEYPNKKGMACSYQDDVFYLGGKRSGLRLPNFIQGYLAEEELNTCTYTLGDIYNTCGDICQYCDEPVICLPLKTVKPIGDNINGIEFCVEYDTNYFEPTGNVTIGEVVLNNGLYTQGADANFYLDNKIPGKVHISVFYSAVQGAEFMYIEDGDVACVEFKLLPNGVSGKTHYFNSCEVRISRNLIVEDNCASTGSFTLEDNSVLSGRIIYRQDETRLLKYDSQNPSNYNITSITNCEKTSTQNYPDLDGYFNYDIKNGKFLTISRDVPGSYNEPCNDYDGDGSCDIADKVNGFDCYNIGMAINLRESYKPGPLEMMAMDVNQNGTVEASDITYIQDRFLGNINEFPQLWNYGTDPQNPTAPSFDWVFVDEKELDEPEFKMSQNFPLDGDEGDLGYSKYNVPLAQPCIEVETATNGICNFVPATTYHAFLLGDVNANWNGEDTPVLLKSQQKTDTQDKIIFDLNRSFVKGDLLYVPVTYSSASNLKSFDFVMENVNPGILELIEIETAHKELNVGYNKNIRMISFAKTFEGIKTSDPIVYMKFKSGSQHISADDFGQTSAYFNGNRTEVEIIEQNSNLTSISSQEIQNKDLQIQIGPNPTSGELNVNVKGNYDDYYSIEIIDMYGKIIYKTESQNDKLTIYLDSHDAGIYYLRYYTNNSHAVKKIILQK